MAFFWHIWREVGLRGELLRGSLGGLAVKIVSAGLALGASIFLARLLRASGYGVYAYCIAVVSILQIPATLGLPNLLVREVAIYLEIENWSLLKGLLVRASQGVALASLVIVSLVLLGTYLLRGHLTIFSTDAFKMSLLLLPITALGALSQGGLIGLRRVILAQLPESLVRQGTFVVILWGVYAWLGGGTWSSSSAIVCQLIASTLAFIVGLRWLVIQLPHPVRIAKATFKTQVWVREALPFMGLGAAQLINNYVDIIMLGIFRSKAEVGVYKACLNIGQLVIFGLTSVNIAIAPHIARLYETKENLKLQRILTTASRATFTFALPLTLAFIFFAKYLLIALFGEEFALGDRALAIICVGQLFNTLMGSVGLTLMMTGLQADVARGVMFAALINGMFNLLLVPKWGILGAATASTLSMISWNISLVLVLRRKTGLNTTIFGRGI